MRRSTFEAGRSDPAESMIGLQEWGGGREGGLLVLVLNGRLTSGSNLAKGIHSLKFESG